MRVVTETTSGAQGAACCYALPCLESVPRARVVIVRKRKQTGFRRCGTWPAGCVYRAALARRGNHSRSLCVGAISRRLGLHPHFSADSLKFLRPQAYEALPIRALTHCGEYPQAKTPVSPDRMSVRYRASHSWASDSGTMVQLICVPFWRSMKGHQGCCSGTGQSAPYRHTRGMFSVNHYCSRSMIKPHLHVDARDTKREVLLGG